MTRDDLDIRDRAERAMRSGDAEGALALYGTLMSKVHVSDVAAYDSWLTGACTAYLALGRQREAGYVLVALRRFADARQYFEPERQPIERALCSAQLGNHADAARILVQAGHHALAAFAWEAAGQPAAAREQWDKLVNQPRLATQPYERSLALFNLGRVLSHLADHPAACRAFADAQRQLEELADECESRGERQRAFDCYAVLLQMGKETGSFENVMEGYLSSIRILIADDQKFFALQYYEDFIQYAMERDEAHVAATLAREAADFSARAGLSYERHYLQRSLAFWQQAERANAQAGGPSELSENYLLAAADVAALYGRRSILRALYGRLAEVTNQPRQKLRYARLAARREPAELDQSQTPLAMPEALRRSAAYQDVWRQDLVEWDLDGQPTAVLVRLVAENHASPRFARLALRAILLSADPTFSLQDPRAAVGFTRALGAVQLYEVVRPLEHLYDIGDTERRAAALDAVSHIFCRRSFDLVKRALQSTDADLRPAALRSLRALRFAEAMPALAELFRSFNQDSDIREAIVETAGHIGTAESVDWLRMVAIDERGHVQEVAQRMLSAHG